MIYMFEAYYQSGYGQPHQKVNIEQLRSIVGHALADKAILAADDRIRNRRVDIPQVKAFFEHGGRQVIVKNLTNRGNIFIEAVEM
ncbi:hypothetical protein LJC33_06580 [Eubacteriales bacterium OttesenSCG-928-N13]|nr:hypothetical protein [Eubacteriales bacterium OttesenSCG-928-N13]